MKDIEQLWLIQRSGVPMFKFPDTQQKMDDSLFAGMLTAILQLVRTSTGNAIENMQMGESSFFIQTIESLEIIIVAKTEKNKKKHQVQKELEVIREKLMKTYDSTTIKKWDGSMEYFKSFAEQLKEKQTADPVNLFFGGKA